MQVHNVFVVLLVVFVVCGALVSGAPRRVQLESPHFAHISRLGPAPSNSVHKVVFAVAHVNEDILESWFNEVTDRTSENYNKFVKRAELADLLVDTKAVDEVVAYLIGPGICEGYEVSKYGDFVTVFATTSQLNKMLRTQFNVYEVNSVARFASESKNKDRNKKYTILRAEEYSIPDELTGFVGAVYNVDQFPSPESYQHPIAPITSPSDGNEVNTDDTQAPDDDEVDGLPTATTSPPSKAYVTPTLLAQHYNIRPSIQFAYYEQNASTSFAPGSQLVYAAAGQSFSPSDLAYFQDTYSLDTTRKIDTLPGSESYESDSACKQKLSNCVEGNLDVQYLLTTAPGVRTEFSYDSDDDDSDFFLLNWLVNVSSMDDPPLVISISYGILEYYISDDFANSFATTAMMLGLQGVTIVAASGDDGANGYNAVKKPAVCGYYPTWPGSCPYVLSVGATMLMSSDSEDGDGSGQFGDDYSETACMALAGGTVTSGGGFSTLYSAPLWQVGIANNYFDVVSTQPYTSTVSSSAGDYNAVGRGYPDVSLVGYNYRIAIAGALYSVSGTSASTPVMAGMISLVNAARLAKGWSPLGFINRELYTNATAFVTASSVGGDDDDDGTADEEMMIAASNFTIDITSGNNLCTSGTSSTATCCKQGFYAAPGWDPVTGFGSVDFEAFYKYFTSPHNAPAALDTSGAPAAATTLRFCWLGGVVWTVVVMIVMALV